jgi:hypothetical protein
MFSFGFQKAFQRGFEADDEVFFTRVRICHRRRALSGETDVDLAFLEESGKRQGGRHGSCRYVGADRIRTLRPGWCVNPRPL